MYIEGFSSLFHINNVELMTSLLILSRTAIKIRDDGRTRSKMLASVLSLNDYLAKWIRNIIKYFADIL